jgi:hypothetical protein
MGMARIYPAIEVRTMDIPEFQRVFVRERAMFASHYPLYTKIARTELKLISGPCTQPGWCAYRDFAYAVPFDEKPEIVINVRLLTFPIENILGVLRHELGHICDPNVSARGREQVADDIAEIVTGRKISYDKDAIQTIGAGTYPRPKYLHS